ncbi:hypothetical protein Kpho01_04670 [Kitasatospora phosalacinea]|uniref:Uncharacterized protein n=1 Tax=Kitasatospora phosalacinea TaxID=2065 RepID=A0A9W6PCJ9_9ACTN|nr:hypothetical protein Kpho01_04670 [Kitasatospora phosalacinea]
MGYRVEMRLSVRAPDECGVLAALALGDRWGHRYSPASCNGGVAKESVWSEVHVDSSPYAQRKRQFQG